MITLSPISTVNQTLQNAPSPQKTVFRCFSTTFATRHNLLVLDTKVVPKVTKRHNCVNFQNIQKIRNIRFLRNLIGHIHVY